MSLWVEVAMIALSQFESYLSSESNNVREIIVALSGGIDSVVLLDLIVKYINNRIDNQHLELLAIHVNHGLSDRADEWADFCVTRCKEYGVECVVECVDVDAKGLGIEAAARQARYQAIAKHVTSQSVVLTAQHQDDQAETLMLALKRGSGVLGLGAMPPVLNFARGKLIRPLLTISRQQIEAYATSEQLPWVEDSSNQQNCFDRNFLRNEVLPQLNQRWPSFNYNLARSSEMCRDSQELLDEIAAADLNDAMITGDCLAINELVELSQVRRNNLIRFWLRQHDLELPSQAVLHQITTQILEAKADSDPVIELGEWQVRRYRQRMFLIKPQVVSEEQSQILEWDCQSELTLPRKLGSLKAGQGLSQIKPVDEVNQVIKLKQPHADVQVTIRFNISGSTKAWPQQRQKRRTIKKLLQEYGVPTWQRQHIPYLFYGEQLVAALGLWVERDFSVNLSGDSEAEFIVNWKKSA
ncbi:tRNA lysidine(34) synthetase TilS [Alteromonadales bacterium alter-6D02]|nr:tRNA lysidine(34) synthetase TilS [Alteromonadales bacterium alter-6D02]